jgi:hypothetical protein
MTSYTFTGDGFKVTIKTKICKCAGLNTDVPPTLVTTCECAASTDPSDTKKTSFSADFDATTTALDGTAVPPEKIKETTVVVKKEYEKYQEVRNALMKQLLAAELCSKKAGAMSRMLSTDQKKKMRNKMRNKRLNRMLLSSNSPGCSGTVWPGGPALDCSRWKSPDDHMDALKSPEVKKRFEEYIDAAFQRVPMPGGVYGDNATISCPVCANKPDSCLLLHSQTCSSQQGEKKKIHNCCPGVCGPGTTTGGYPVMWDADAVVEPQGTDRGDFVKIFGSQTCAMPSTMPKHAHLVRVTPCWGDYTPFCAIVKITQRNSTASSPSKELVMGWGDITGTKPCKVQGGTTCTGANFMAGLVDCTN